MRRRIDPEVDGMPFQIELETLTARIRELETELAAERATHEQMQQFVYSASHDLKAPLRTITSFAGLLAKRHKGKLDRDGDECIQFILGATRRMEKLISDLLQYFRLLSDPPKPLEDVNMEAVVHWVLMNLNGEMTKSGAHISHGPMPTVQGNQEQITQVVQQLFSNALQYRSERPPEVSFTAEEREDGWLFTVADNGTGFEMAYAEQIFGPFKRLHDQQTDGSGMGLTLCRKIVEKHGGRIWAESTPGVGSRFYFTLAR